MADQMPTELTRIAVEYGRSLSGSPAEEYLRVRGIDPDAATAAGVGWNGQKNALSIPYYGHDGGVCAIQYRTLEKNKKCWWERGGSIDAPFIASRIGNGGVLYICEGEVDALRLASMSGLGETYTIWGIPGAQQWKEEFVLLLRSMQPEQVLVFPDLDEAGQRLATKISTTVPEALIVDVGDGREELTPKYDLTDLLNERGGETLFWDAVGNASVRPASSQPAGVGTLPLQSGVEWITSVDSEAASIVPGVLVAGGLAILAGEPKTGKSWLAYSLALSVANGVDFLSQYPVTKAGRVLLIANEGSANGAKARFRGLALGMGLAPVDAMTSIDVIWRKPAALDDPTFIEALTSQVDSYALVIVDVLAKAWSGEENSNREAGGLLRNIENLTGRGASVMLVHHLAKVGDSTSSRRMGQRLRGASAFHGAVDSGIYLERGKKSSRTTCTFEQKDFSPAEPFTFAWPEDQCDGSSPISLDWQAHSESTEKALDRLPKILEAVEDEPGQSRTGIVDAVGGNRSAVMAAIAAALASGQLYEMDCTHNDSMGRSRTRKGLYPKDGNPLKAPISSSSDQFSQVLGNEVVDSRSGSDPLRGEPIAGAIRNMYAIEHGLDNGYSNLGYCSDDLVGDWDAVR